MPPEIIHLQSSNDVPDDSNAIVISHLPSGKHEIMVATHRGWEGVFKFEGGIEGGLEVAIEHACDWAKKEGIPRVYVKPCIAIKNVS